MRQGARCRTSSEGAYNGVNNGHVLTEPFLDRFQAMRNQVIVEEFLRVMYRSVSVVRVEFSDLWIMVFNAYLYDGNRRFIFASDVTCVLRRREGIVDVFQQGECANDSCAKVFPVCVGSIRVGLICRPFAVYNGHRAYAVYLYRLAGPATSPPTCKRRGFREHFFFARPCCRLRA